MLTKVAIFFLYLLSLLPFWVLYLLSDAVFIILFYVAKYRRKVVQENLRNAFPEKTAAERSQIERQFYRYLGDLLVESVKMFSISREQLNQHFHVANPEMLNSYFANKQSIIGAVGHYGNWEMAALALSLCTDHKKLIVYKPIKNKQIEAVTNQTRGKFGAQLVAMKATMRTLVSLKNEQIITVFVSDQTPVREETQYFASFLNQPTAIFLGVEKLAKLTNSAVIFCDIRVVKRGYYSCTFVPLINEPKRTAEHEITDLHVQYLEKVIREEPAYWLWSHRRWKFKPEDIHR
ncbi:lysophospholipid acyltransferase family protein [Mucilaginibacter sp.]|uniref:lysophospholipid acyltransferase family protein n=1 Tax=Mucilaginibacter sp. TaxID=1882438 RepID=UPI003AFFEAAA